MALISFEEIERAWEQVKKTRLAEFKKYVPGLERLDPIRCELIRREVSHITVQFINLEEAVSQPDEIALLKSTIIGWLKQFSNVKIERTSTSNLIVRITPKPHLGEAAVTVYKRVGGKIVPALKCLGGPKDGKKVSDPSVCNKPVDHNRRVASKYGQIANKGAIKKSKTKTKITNIVSRRLKKANARLKKARGF